MPIAPLIQEIAYADPLAVFAPVADDPYAALLHSAANDARGRYSFVATDPFAVLVCRDGEVEIDGVPRPGAPLEVVRAELARHAQPPAPGGVPFRGGAVGYLGYEMGRHLERVPRPPADAMDVPEMQLMFCDVVVAFDHLERRAFIISTGHPERHDDARRARARSRLRAAAARFADPPAAAPPPSPRSAPAIAPDMPREVYESAVRRVVDYILAGDVFQANLLAALPRRAARRARPVRSVPAPVRGQPGALRRLPRARRRGASPRRRPSASCALSGDLVETRPIKGTRPRGRTPAEDEARSPPGSWRARRTGPRTS